MKKILRTKIELVQAYLVVFFLFLFLLELVGTLIQISFEEMRYSRFVIFCLLQRKPDIVSGMLFSVKFENTKFTRNMYFTVVRIYDHLGLLFCIVSYVDCHRLSFCCSNPIK